MIGMNVNTAHNNRTVATNLSVTMSDGYSTTLFERESMSVSAVTDLNDR